MVPTPILALTVAPLLPVTTLLADHAGTIAKLRGLCSTRDAIDITQLPYSNSVFFLRYCLSASSPSTNTATISSIDEDAVLLKFKDSLDWRLSPVGQRVTNLARMAVDEASADRSGWNNNVVYMSAPHSSTIRNYITSQNCITTTTQMAGMGDLVYCIRAGAIDDVGLMKAVSIDQMIEFFLYVKEVNALVCDMRSLSTNALLHTVTCNDLSGVKLLGGSADFRKALSSSSNLAATTIYPGNSYAGPTLLVNLPPILAALVKLFTPLFPASVQARLKFPGSQFLSGVTDLTQIASNSASPERNQFLQDLKAIL